MATPRQMPKPAAMAKPTMNSLRLTRMCFCRSPVLPSFRNLVQISDSGAMISGHLPVRPTISQAVPTITNDSSPRAVAMCSRYQRTGHGSAARPNWRSRTASAMELCLQRLLEQTHVDVLHRIRRQVVRCSGFLEIVNELQGLFLVDVQVLGNHLVRDVQVVGVLGLFVADAHGLLGDGQQLGLAGRVVHP